MNAAELSTGAPPTHGGWIAVLLGLLGVGLAWLLISYVTGKPAPLADEGLESLGRALAAGVKAAPDPCLNVCRRVRITAGPSADHEGIVVRRKGTVRAVLSLDLNQRSIVIAGGAAAVGHAFA